MNRNTETNVWRRVYAKPPAPLSPRDRRELQACLQRAQENLRRYERGVRDPIYGDAFARMAAETAEHCKMLRQILR